jgi:hypothetical protein
MIKIKNSIWVEYTDRMINEKSTIQYSVDIRIRAAGTVTVTGTLVTRLKTFKLFLGFNWLQAVNPMIDWRNQEVKTSEETKPAVMRSVSKAIPDYPRLFQKVFSEQGFQDLPPWRKWDHAINLKEDHVPLNGRCYPLAARERDALKTFIETNQRDGKK